MVSDDRQVRLTFDLFSALVDSRTGAGAAFDELATAHGWSVEGERVYDAWDSRNKQAQRLCVAWAPYPVLAREALTQAYSALGLEGDVDTDLAAVLDSIPTWPLWPDVPEHLPALRQHYPIGVLSNVDDDLFALTRAAAYVDADLVMSSQRLGVYKPNPLIYRRAQDELGPMVHVASSARDVRGALEAGVPTVRLRTLMEALRCLKRRLSDLLYKAMLDDLGGHTRTGPGGSAQHGRQEASSYSGSNNSSGTGGQADSSQGTSSYPS